MGGRGDWCSRQRARGRCRGELRRRGPAAGPGPRRHLRGSGARLTCGCSLHGNGRRPGGAGAQVPRLSFPGPGAQPPAGLPRLRHRFVLPLPLVPEPLGPGAGQRQQLVLGIRRRGHGWRSPRRGDSGLAGPRCGGWRSLLLPPPGLGTWGGCGVSTAAAAAAATPAELLPLSSRQLLLLPLLFLWAPPPALLLPLQAPPRRLPRYSQACYYAGENGLLWPSPPQHTSAPGRLWRAPLRGCAKST